MLDSGLGRDKNEAHAFEFYLYACKIEYKGKNPRVLEALTNARKSVGKICGGY